MSFILIYYLIGVPFAYIYIFSLNFGVVVKLLYIKLLIFLFIIKMKIGCLDKWYDGCSFLKFLILFKN